MENLLEIPFKGSKHPPRPKTSSENMKLYAWRAFLLEKLIGPKDETKAVVYHIKAKN